MATAAVEGATETLPAVPPEHRPTAQGVLARAVVALLLVVAVLALPLFLNSVWDDKVSLAAIYAIIGLSINILMGYAGQISLGHQAFVGIGAFTSAYVVGPHMGASFVIALPAAGLVGAIMALALGLIALRIRGLYLALITLAFGLVAQGTIFNIRSFTGGGAGAPAPRPAAFQSNQAYAYLCLIVLGLFLIVDWRLSKTKGGRAIVAVRNNEQVAATLGVNVTGYKLLAFVTSGLIAGIAGALFAHWTQHATSPDFELATALLWVLMTVVGGLGSRAGVVIGSAFFAVFPYLPGLSSTKGFDVPVIGTVTGPTLAPLLGALLLILTLTLYPGGIGQQLLPVRRWLAGGPFHEPKRARLPEESEVEPFETTPVRAVGAEGDASAPSGTEHVTEEVPAAAPERKRGLRAFRKSREKDST